MGALLYAVGLLLVAFLTTTPWGTRITALLGSSLGMRRVSRARVESIVLSGLGGFLLGVALFFFAIGVTTDVGPFGIAVGSICVAPAIALLFAWPITRWVWIPLAQPEAALFMMSLHGGLGDRAGGAAGHDKRGVAALSAALATLRKRTRSEADLALLERFAWSGRPLGGARLVTHGLLAFMRGDHATARATFAAALSFPKNRLPRLAYDVASDWRAADLASRGEWGELASYGEAREHASTPTAFRWRLFLAAVRAAHRRDAHRLERLGVSFDSSDGRLRIFFRAMGAARVDLRAHRIDRVCNFAQRLLAERSASPGTRFLGRVALRLVRAPGGPSDRALKLAWFFAPHRSRSRALLHRALAIPAMPSSHAVELATPTEDVGWDAALAIAVRLVETPVGRPRLLLARWIGQGLDVAFTREQLPATMAKRGAVIDSAPMDAIDAVHAQASCLLASLALARRVPTDAIACGGSVTDRAVVLMRERLIEDIVEEAAALGRRVKDKTLLDVSIEGAAFGKVVHAHRRLLQLAGDRGVLLVWERVRSPLWNFAQFACGAGREPALGHSIFAWLLDCARIAGDKANTEILERNVNVTA